MKRIFSKRSGFTLVEIIVAFAVFAIMATMILSMVQLTVRQRNVNAEFSATIENDNQYLVSHFVDKSEYSTSEGKFSLVFPSDNINATLDYQVQSAGHANNTQGINYFVGDTDYRDPDDPQSDLQAQANGAGGNGQDARYDTWLKGSRGLTSITVWDVQKVPQDDLSDGDDPNQFNGPGVCYMFKTSAAGSDLDADYSKYATYTLSFKMPTTTEIVRMEEDGKKYNVKVPDPAKIIDCGYVNNNSLLWNDQNGTCLDTLDHIPRASYTHNQLLVEQSGPNSIHITSTFRSAACTFSNTAYSCFYVVFESDPQITVNSFGDNGVAAGAAGMSFGCYPIKDEDGDPTGDVEYNIYGANELQKTLVP